MGDIAGVVGGGGCGIAAPQITHNAHMREHAGAGVVTILMARGKHTLHIPW